VAGGLALRQCPRVHLKVVVVDGALLYLGSANWTGAGLGAKGEHRRNFELGVVTDDDTMLDAVQARYDALWRGAECGACRLRSECEAPLDLDARPPATGPLVRLRPAGPPPPKSEPPRARTHTRAQIPTKARTKGRTKGPTKAQPRERGGRGARAR
jgi:phosphatidylserine/phosphatidylglycerophosphate/cardiolipin synthase-like enzyme